MQIATVWLSTAAPGRDAKQALAQEDDVDGGKHAPCFNQPELFKRRCARTRAMRR